jgi:hypothetical protein
MKRFVNTLGIVALLMTVASCNPNDVNDYVTKSLDTLTMIDSLTSQLRTPDTISNSSFDIIN